MELNTVFQQIIVLFLIIFTGFYCSKKNIMDEIFTNKLSNFLLQVTLPLLIISSFSISFTADIKRNVVKAFIYGFIMFIVTPIIVKLLLLRNDKRKRNILQFAMVFSNGAFMGFPIAQSVFGNEGVVYVSIFNIIFNIFVWTYGIMLFKDTNNKKDIKKILTNPGILAAIIGILIMIFSITIPPILLNTMKLVGGITTPASMLVIGSLLSRTNLKNLFRDGSLYYGSFIKLLFIPGALYLISSLFKESSIVIKTFILLQAMPAGAVTSLFAESFNKDKEYSALIVSLTTLLSIVTIPLVIKFCL